LLTWGLDAADVSRMAGHANVRITLDRLRAKISTKIHNLPGPGPPGLTGPRPAGSPAGAKEGPPVHGMISALVAAGVNGGYLANPDGVLPRTGFRQALAAIIQLP
jgi:hypothetical protein